MEKQLKRWARRKAKKTPVGACISKSMHEGKPQDQAVAIALSKEERGDLPKKAGKLARWAKRKAARDGTDPTVATIQKEAKAAGATLANDGKGGLDPAIALAAFRKAGWRCGNKYCPTPKEELDLDHSSGHPKEIFDSLKQWQNPKLRAAATKADGPKDDNYVSVLCAKCHDMCHERERALEAGNSPPPMRGTGKKDGKRPQDVGQAEDQG